MKKLYSFFLFAGLVFAGCATDSPKSPTWDQSKIHPVDQPYTFSEIGDNHVLIAIFLSIGFSEQSAKDTNRQDSDSVGLSYRTISEKIEFDKDTGIYSVRREVEFLIPKILE